MPQHPLVSVPWHSGCTHQHCRSAEPDPAATPAPLLLPSQEKTQPLEFQPSSRTLFTACFLCLPREDRLSKTFIGNSRCAHRGEPNRQTGGLSGQGWHPTGGPLPLGPRGTFRLQAVQPVGHSCAGPPGRGNSSSGRGGH